MTEKWCTAASNALDFMSKVFKPREDLFVYDQTFKIGYPLGERRIINSLSDLGMSKDTSHPPKSESLLATTRGAFGVPISCTTCSGTMERAALSSLSDSELLACKDTQDLHQSTKFKDLSSLSTWSFGTSYIRPCARRCSRA